jgi:hypothetical protein
MRPPASRAILAVATLVLAAASGVSAYSQDPSPSAVPTTDLPDGQLDSGLVIGHTLGLPSPPELLYVLSKQGSPKWRKLYLPVIKGQESDRTKTALRLGLSIAEGHLATMARDAQKIRDITNDLQRYAKVLGINDELAENARNINHLAENKAWTAIAYELELLVTQTSDILRSQLDTDLANLITTGLWVRLLQVSTSVVTEEDFPDTSIAISSRWTLEQLIAPHAESKNPLVISIRDQLAKIARLWAPEKLAAGHSFNDALVRHCHDRLSSIVQLCTK